MKTTRLREFLNKLIPFMVRPAHHERNQPLTVRPELAPLALPMVVEGFNQSFLSLCLCVAMPLWLFGCAESSSHFFEGVSELPKQMVSRQVLVTLPENLKSDWATIREELARQNDILKSGEFPLPSIGVDCLVYQVPEQENLEQVIQQLQADSRVVLAQENQVFEGIQSSASDEFAAISYAPKLVHADTAHQLATGKGIRIAVVDTGAEKDHPDFKDQHLETANFVDGSDYAFTHDRHGTAITGVIAAKANDEAGISGISPDAEVSVLKACWYTESSDAKAQCSSWSLAKALDAAISKKAHIINLSLAGPHDDLLNKLLEVAHKRGINIVAASLEKQDQPGFPAQLPFTIPVISTGPDGQVVQPVWLPQFPGVVVAPGIEILTTVPNDGYDLVSGSSLAAAHVSGIIALLLEVKPNLSPDQIKGLLLRNGKQQSTAPLRSLDAWAILQTLNIKN
jgi:subtilisin family serine protease